MHFHLQPKINDVDNYVNSVIILTFSNIKNISYVLKINQLMLG